MVTMSRAFTDPLLDRDLFKFTTDHLGLFGDRETYPPFNIKTVDNTSWTLELAVAGFEEKDLQVELVDQNTVLVVRGVQNKEEKVEEERYLHKGIATRAFMRKFSLRGEELTVNDATLQNGLLRISVARVVPETAAPVLIPINSGKIAIEKTAEKTKNDTDKT